MFGSMGAGVAIAEWLDQGIVAGDRIEIEVLDASQTKPSQPNSLYDRSQRSLP